MELEKKPDFEPCMKRIYAWYNQEIIDRILEMPEINAIQWVQGVGNDLPIMQWVPFIKKIQAAGKSVVVDLQLSELEGFIRETNPEGLLLCIAADPEIQPDVIERVKKW